MNPALAEILGLPRVAVVKKLEWVAGSCLGTPAARVRRMFVPPKGEGVEMLGKDPAEVAQKIKQLIEEKMR